MSNTNPIEMELKRLRLEWKQYPSRRAIIEVVAKILKRQLKDYEERENLVRKTLIDVQ